ncbi:hypothetical protein SAMN05880590_101298 [Rhizobium sp. RU35A]|nr:hypothetical protein SAMN05880590_101298 [Rhizobium sp. RU35A]
MFMPYLARRFALMTLLIALFAGAFGLLAREVNKDTDLTVHLEMLPRYR